MTSTMRPLLLMITMLKWWTTRKKERRKKEKMMILIMNIHVTKSLQSTSTTTATTKEECRWQKSIDLSYFFSRTQNKSRLCVRMTVTSCFIQVFNTMYAEDNDGNFQGVAISSGKGLEVSFLVPLNVSSSLHYRCRHRFQSSSISSSVAPI